MLGWLAVGVGAADLLGCAPQHDEVQGGADEHYGLEIRDRSLGLSSGISFDALRTAPVASRGMIPR
jgi:hypothetical protein